MNGLKMAPVILTHEGKLFDLLQPERNYYSLHVIAHALSHICRFNGHTHTFYSVAQHSVLVSHLVPDADAMSGLLHDAAEAFIGDVSSPLKQLLPDYKQIEKRLEHAIRSHFGLPLDLPDSVRHADMQMLATEKRDLMPVAEPWDCLSGVEPVNLRITPWTAAEARMKFMRRFNEL